MTGLRRPFWVDRAMTANPAVARGTLFSRRALLQRAASGFGAVALSALLCDDTFSASSGSIDPLAPRRGTLPARAKRVIFLYMDGGPSQVDTFDPKPRLDRENGLPFKMKVQPTQFDNVG